MQNFVAKTNIVTPHPQLCPIVLKSQLSSKISSVFSFKKFSLSKYSFSIQIFSLGKFRDEIFILRKKDQATNTILSPSQFFRSREFLLRNEQLCMFVTPLKLPLRSVYEVNLSIFFTTKKVYKAQNGTVTMV